MRRPLPGFQTRDCEVCNERYPLLVPLHCDELAQLVVGLEPCEQAAELVVVVVLRQARPPAQHLGCAADEVREKRRALRLRAEKRAAYAREAHEALEREAAHGRLVGGVGLQKGLRRRVGGGGPRRKSKEEVKTRTNAGLWS